MIPLRDNLPTERFPVITVALIAINIALFVWQLSFPTDEQLDRVGFSAINQSALEYGAIPQRITHPDAGECAIGVTAASGQAEVVCEGTPEFREARRAGELNPGLKPIPLDQAPWLVTLFTSMFMHGGILHIAFNLLFLWVFGNNVEDSMGRARFVLFYLLGGLVALYSQAALDPSSTVPTIGASGAVAAVLGAYALLHPRTGVLTLVIFIFVVTLVEIPAWILLTIWFMLQFLPAIGQTAVETGGQGGVAYFAHVGGFIFGLALIRLFTLGRDRRQHEAAYRAF